MHRARLAPLSRPPPADLDGFVRFQIARGNVPGLAAAILRDGEVAWTGTFGMADLAEGKIQFGKDWDSDATNAQIAAMFLGVRTTVRKGRKTAAKSKAAAKSPKRAPRRNRVRSKS